MFNYTESLINLYQNIVRSYVKKTQVAVDCTLGRGNDALFLNTIFDKVYAFEIQEQAIQDFKEKNSKVIVFHESHEKIWMIEEEIDFIIYNLGYLPKGDKSITTNAETTLISVKNAMKKLCKWGIIIIIIYPGHEEGKREQVELLKYLKNVDKSIWGVMHHEMVNREKSPSLLLIEKYN
ncbi:MAG: class I SAM-dependent methyltransferase [Oscillospiraceae bacterium]|nr:class I SAM-dependent methyltransferase [Oscillospiraceae bacterium]